MVRAEGRRDALGFGLVDAPVLDREAREKRAHHLDRETAQIEILKNLDRREQIGPGGGFRVLQGVEHPVQRQTVQIPVGQWDVLVAEVALREALEAQPQADVAAGRLGIVRQFIFDPLTVAMYDIHKNSYSQKCFISIV